MMEDQTKMGFCLDRISNLPPSIIESILSRLPTKEAVRTSILSTEWKYHWTKIPNFHFIQNVKVYFLFKPPRNQVNQEEEEMNTEEKRKLFSVINQVIMSPHQSPIEDFTLYTRVRGASLEVDHIIDHFSRNNNLKKLELVTRGYRLPESFFSLHKLTDLYLGHCRLDDVQPTTFSGFSSLTNLSMNRLRTTKRMLQPFLSGCPLLKTITLIPNFQRSPDNDDSTLAQLFECLPVIENLTVRFSILKFYDQGRDPKLLPPTALVHLKHLCILDESYKYRFHSFVYLVRSCPNIEKLTLKISTDLHMPGGEGTIEGDRFYSDVWLGHLEEVEIYFFAEEMIFFHAFILILQKSPMLKKVKILLSYKASKKEKSTIIWAFSIYPRVSRVVEFVIERMKA